MNAITPGIPDAVPCPLLFDDLTPNPIHFTKAEWRCMISRKEFSITGCEIKEIIFVLDKKFCYSVEKQDLSSYIIFPPLDHSLPF
jgi:hypothetical protein